MKRIGFGNQNYFFNIVVTTELVIVVGIDREIVFLCHHDIEIDDTNIINLLISHEDTAVVITFIHFIFWVNEFHTDILVEGCDNLDRFDLFTHFMFLDTVLIDNANVLINVKRITENVTGRIWINVFFIQRFLEPPKITRFNNFINIQTHIKKNSSNISS